MRPYKIVDLFCGAGGSSTGAKEAAEALGYSADLTVVNHWDKAIETHKLNHPEARHFCTGVDNINPRDLFGEDELSALLASPECTHHSVARGGRPVNEQSRATAMCVIRWAEALRPPVIIIENVPEFRSWGPLIRKRVDGVMQWVPDPAHKGELFEAWLQMLRATGYRVEHRVVCCADYGDATTRRRLFILCARGRRKVFWPDPTHVENPSAELFGRRPWVPARDIIDWQLKGTSIYDRKKALSPKTMARIFAGLEKFSGLPFIVPQHTGNNPRSVDRPAPVVTTTSRGIRLCQPFIVPNFGEQNGQTPRCHSVDKPAPAVTSRGAGNLVEPFLVNLKGKSKVRSVKKPTPAITAKAQHLYLAEPFLIQTDQTGSNGSCVRSVNRPPGTIVSKQNLGLVEPFLVKNRGTGKASDIDKPTPTITAGGKHLGLAEPFLVQVSHGNDHQRERNPNKRRSKSIHKPLPAVSGSNDWALIEPALLGQQSGAVLRPVSAPAPTVATDGAIALIEPVITKYYGTGVAQSVHETLDTVTTKERFGLAEPIVFQTAEGEFMLDIRYRMLQPHELSLAQGFKRGYKFTGTKTEIVKMIGNAVPRRTLRALLLAMQSQRNDISDLAFEDKAHAA